MFLRPTILENIKTMSDTSGRGWTESGMGHLCMAWLQLSEDASVRTDQKADVFWCRVCDTLAAHFQAVGLPAMDKE